MTTATDISAPDASERNARTALFRRLRELKRACGRNQHDQVTILIDALLDEGIDTSPRILGVLKQLDFVHAHAVLILKNGLTTRRWTRDIEGRYRHASES